MTTKLKAVPGVGQVKKKDFTFEEVTGFMKIIEVLKKSNPQISIRTDFWLHKNQEAIRPEFDKYLQDEFELMSSGFAEGKEIGGVKYVQHKGADENDLKYISNNAWYEFDGEKMNAIPFPLWEKELQPASEGKEAVVGKFYYTPQFVSPESEKDFGDKLLELQQNYKFELSLHLLEPKYMDGVNVIWRDKNEDMSWVRPLLYDNLIKHD